MYMTEDQKKTFSKFFNDEEIKQINFYDKIKDEKVLPMLKESTVYAISVDYNSFGEFLFIHFFLEEENFFIYGLGWHEYRNQVYREYWKLESAGYYPKEKVKKIPFEKIEKAINERKKEIENLRPKPMAQEHIDFDLIADVADEDAALMYFE